jgi:hypothetical protein
MYDHAERAAEELHAEDYEALGLQCIKGTSIVLSRRSAAEGSSYSEYEHQ